MLVLVVALGPLAGTATGSTATGGIASADPVGDFLRDCDPSATTQPGPAAMDLLGARSLGEQNGYAVFEVETAGDASAYFSSEPPSASFVITVTPVPGGPRYELIREIHEGRRRSVVERDGEAVAGTGLLVSRAGSGMPRFAVSGIPGIGTQTRWGVTSNVLPDRKGPKLCDRYGLDTGGNPELPVQSDAAAVTTTTQPPTTSTTAPKGGGNSATDSSSWIWLLLGLCGIVGVAVFLWWLFTKKWSRRPAPGDSHGAPDTPPPGGNDFGE